MIDSIIKCFDNNQLDITVHFPLVLAQINKDIRNSGGDFALDINASHKTTFNKMCNKVQEWLTTNEVDLQTLLYRIDVPEKEIKKDLLTPERVTELIFKREIVKIKFRKEYGSF